MEIDEAPRVNLHQEKDPHRSVAAVEEAAAPVPEFRVRNHPVDDLDSFEVGDYVAVRAPQEEECERFWIGEAIELDDSDHAAERSLVMDLFDKVDEQV